MGWIVYIKDNKDGIDLLKIITQEPNKTFAGIVESYEKAGIFSKDSYMKKGKKIIRGSQKILRILSEESRINRRPPPPKKQSSPLEYPNLDYENSMYDTMFSGEQDDEVDEKQSSAQIREARERRAAEMMEKRKNVRPPPRIPKEEMSEKPTKREKKDKQESVNYESAEIQGEEDIQNYINDMISRHGDD